LPANIGSIIAVTLATLLAFVQFGLCWAGAILAGLIAIDQVLGNFVDPRLQGRTLGVFALVVLLAGDLLAWLWGIAGAFLAVPLTVTIILACPTCPPSSRSPCCSAAAPTSRRPTRADAPWWLPGDPAIPGHRLTSGSWRP
jgi:predicted PurR-regulated permease PerM